MFKQLLGKYFLYMQVQWWLEMAYNESTIPVANV